MLVFDFEVFRYDWLVVFKDTTTNEYHIIINDRDELEKFYNENKNQLHIGFNNKRYDNLVYRATLDGADPYEVNEMIITHDNPLGVYRTWNLNKWWYPSMDVGQDTMRGSLKEFEGYLGLNIDETTVPFNISRKLTPDEIDEVIMYCKSDVDATQKLVELNATTLETKIRITQRFNMTQRDWDKTNAQLVGALLLDKKKNYYDEFNPFPFENHTLNLPTHTGEVKVGSKTIRESTIFDFYNKAPNYQERLVIDLLGVEHVMAYGGLHGARKSYKYEGEIWLLDVGSYYPSIMLEYEYLSRNARYEQFREIYNDRMRIRHTDKELGDIYKLILNTTFGASKDKYNPLYDPHNANNICISGQLMLVDLLYRIKDHVTLIQSNTDGVMVIPHNRSEVKRIAEEWEKIHRMTLDIDVFKAIYQKDVNNYIAVTPDDEIEALGGYVRQTTLNGHNPRSLRNTEKVVDDAVVNYFVNGVSPEKTIIDCNNKTDFQMIRKTGRSYDGTVWEVNGKDIPVQLVNRVYATKDTRYGKLYKVDSTRRDTVPSLPDHCYVANKDDFDFSNIDRQFYIDRAWDRIRQFGG